MYTIIGNLQNMEKGNIEISQLKKVLDLSLSKLFYPMNDGHDIFHLRRTCEYALRITNSLKETKDIKLIIVASYLHDLHRINPDFDWITNTSKIILEKANISLSESQFINLQEILKLHDEKLPCTSSIELKIIQDADKLDRIGFNGIIRAIRFGACKGEDFYNSSNNSTISHLNFLIDNSNQSYFFKFSKKLSKKLVRQTKHFIQKAKKYASIRYSSYSN